MRRYGFHIPNWGFTFTLHALSSCVRCGLEHELRFASHLNRFHVCLDPRGLVYVTFLPHFLFFFVISTTVALLHPPISLSHQLRISRPLYFSGSSLFDTTNPSCLTPLSLQPCLVDADVLTVEDVRCCFCVVSCISLARSSLLFLENASETESIFFRCHLLASCSSQFVEQVLHSYTVCDSFHDFAEYIPFSPPFVPQFLLVTLTSDRLTFFSMV